jgi:hypothetical protein
VCLGCILTIGGFIYAFFQGRCRRSSKFSFQTKFIIVLLCKHKVDNDISKFCIIKILTGYTYYGDYKINSLRFNPFQSSDTIWHHSFNSVLHMLQFLGAGMCYPLLAPKNVVFLGWKRLTLPSPKIGNIFLD